MQTNEEFRIEVSLSKERFIDKKISNAMIGSVKKNPEYRQTRKDYGFDSRSGVSFDDERLLTPSELLNELITGAAICPVFNPSKRKKNGGFGSYQKKNRNFCYSSFIGVDIDKTSYSSPEQFIDKLNLKPTLWYTSYSNMTRDEEEDYEGPRFRLIYVFNSYIDSPFYFRYCSSLLNDIIIKDTGEKINDTCNVRCTQYYNGTNIYNEELDVSYGITNIIYDLEDIGVKSSKSTDKDYIEFLCRGCDYKSLSKNQRYEIKRELKRTALKNYFYHYNKKRFEIPQFNSTTINEQTEKDRTLQYEWEYEFYETETFSPSIKTILYDWDKRTTEDFMKCTQWVNAVKNTKYVYRKEREWVDKKYQWVDDDYFSLFHFRK